MIMNELDEMLTERKLDTRIVFICYVDTLFAPREVIIQNPKRFSLLYAPITRTYLDSITEDSVIPEPPEYVYNKWKSPETSEENLSFLRDWQKDWKGPTFSYEYHFWKNICFDPSGYYLAKRVYEDIRGLKAMNLDGYVEDGSQRCFWPNGLAIYVFAEAQMDPTIPFEDLVEDYYSHIYGEDWKDVKVYLEKLVKAFDYKFMFGLDTKDNTISNHYNPDYKEAFESVKTITAEAKKMIAEHLAMPTRPQTVSWRLLNLHTEFCDSLAEFMIEKCMGNNDRAEEIFNEKLCKDFGKYEVEIERYYDHYLYMVSYYRTLVQLPKTAVIQFTR